MKLYRHSSYHLKIISFHIVFNIIPIYPKLHYTTLLLLCTFINKCTLATVVLHILVGSMMKLHIIIIVTSKYHSSLCCSITMLFTYFKCSIISL